MKKQTWFRVGGICLLAAAVILVLGEALPLLLLPILLNTSFDSYSVGVIGGADGPTSVLVAASDPAGTIASVAAAIVMLAVGIILLKKAKR